MASLLLNFTLFSFLSALGRLSDLVAPPVVHAFWVIATYRLGLLQLLLRLYGVQAACLNVSITSLASLV